MHLQRSKMAAAAASLFLGAFQSVAAATLQLPLTDDAWINGNQATTNYGGATALNVHNYGPKFTLVRFDAAPIAGKTVTRATLLVFLRSIGPSGQMTVYPIASSWNEGTVTWALQPPSEATATAKIALTTAMAGTVISIDVTSVAQRWTNGSLADAGFLLSTVNPIKAIIDSKELAGGTPVRLQVETGDALGAIVLDLSDPENCAIDQPGYYVLDRSWYFSPHASMEPNGACEWGVLIQSANVTVDMRGFGIYSGNEWGDFKPVVRIDTQYGVVLRNGIVQGVFTAIGATVASDRNLVRLEQIHASGSTELRNRLVEVQGGRFEAINDMPGLEVGAGSRVFEAEVLCTQARCLHGIGSGIVFRDNRVNANVGYGIQLDGSNGVIKGTIGDNIIVYGDSNIVADNIFVGDCEIDGTANVVDGNIVGSMSFQQGGNFFGDNRASGGFGGTVGQTDWAAMSPTSAGWQFESLDVGNSDPRAALSTLPDRRYNRSNGNLSPVES